MFFIKNVVAKLWMTIIVLVAVVLVILGLFLFKYIDNSFPKANDQQKNLTVLAQKVAVKSIGKLKDPQYAAMMNELLGVQDAGMNLVLKEQTDLHVPLFNGLDSKLQIGDVFSQDDLASVFSGKMLAPQKISRDAGHTPDDFLTVVVPVKDAAGIQDAGALILYQSLKSVEDTRYYVKRLFAFVSMIGFLLTTFFAFFLITRITRPMLQLKKAADLIADGEYGTRVPVVSSDEIGQLTNTFNLMGARLEETITDLNHEKENLASVLRSMTDAVISFDVEGNIIFTNPPGEQLIRDWSGIQWAGPEAVESTVTHLIPEPLQHFFETVVSETRELTAKLHVQNGVWSFIMAPLYSSDTIRGVVVVLRDVTEESRLEKLRKDFVANVSHELRTPLSMLQGYSEALLDDIAGTPEERKELAQIIYDESLRMGRLVKDLLDLARMEAGHMDLQLRTVALTPLFKRVNRKFGALCKERGLQLTVELPEEDFVLRRSDEDRLEQVLTNLLDNAIRHTKSGKQIYLRTALAKIRGRAAIRIEIEDQGEGIPEDDVPYVFERFYKADKARKRGSSGGTGLGLAIVRTIIEAHHGQIAVRSKVGQGTTFSILLPIDPDN